MTRLRAALALFAFVQLLAACGGSAPAPVIPSQPPVATCPTVSTAMAFLTNPPSIECVPTFAADFSALNVQAWCEQDTPVPCNPGLSPDAIWTSFNRPGDQGLGCVGTVESECWKVLQSTFVTKPVIPGFPIISTRTFDRTKRIDVRANISAQCTDPACWAGPVLYDGELYWEAIYYSYLDANHVRLSVWTPSAIVVIFDSIPVGQAHTVDLIYDACTWSAEVDGAEITVGAPANHLCLPDDPHVAVFSGQESLTVNSLTVYEGP